MQQTNRPGADYWYRLRRLARAARPSKIGAQALFLSSTLAFGLSLPALATAPQDVTITAVLTSGDSGPWSATGAIEDAGAYLRTDLHLTGSIFHSPVVGSGHDTVTFTGTDGSSFTEENQVLFTGCCSFTGQWVVVGGTGIYAGLLGQGTLASDGNNVVLQGQVHLNGG